MGTVLDARERGVVEHDRTAFNLAVWDKIVANPEFAALPYRFETDEHGQIIMSPLPAPNHGRTQIRIGGLLQTLAPAGECISECPVSTGKGVKAIDVAWCSPEIWNESEGRFCLLRAPEICVEILSPSNTRGEIEEKKALYFQAGAKEVWLCAEDGTMSFFSTAGRISRSEICEEFPEKVV